MSLYTALMGLAFVIGTILIAWAVYFTMRRIAGDALEVETETLAGSVIFRVSALHGLILALVFAQELVNYNQLHENIVSEATAIADIYHDIGRYDTEAESTVREALSAYLHTVVETEWDILAREDPLSARGWELRETVYLALLDLTPETPRQVSLRTHMMSKIQLIAELRQERENTSLHDVSYLFWAAALVGVILVTIPYFIFSPSRLNLVLLSVYAGFSGFVMFVIFAFSDPFSEPGALPPTAFERLLETEIGTARR